MKKHLNKIITILLVSIIMITTFLIGGPLTNNVQIVNILIAITAILSIINNHKDEKSNFKISDLFMLLVIISSTIPIIFGTRVSLYSSVEYVIRYISVGLIYFTLRNEFKNNPKLEKYIINTIIVSAAIMVVFGIDLMTTNYMFDLAYVLTGFLPTMTNEIRMESLFEYTNAFAVYIAVSVFLILGKIQECKKTKMQVLYKVIFMWLTTGIICSESKGVILTMILTIGIYLWLTRKKLICNLKVLLPNTCMAIIFSSILFQSITLGLQNKIWLFVIIGTTISIFVNYLIEKIKIRKYINGKIIVTVILVCISVFSVVMLNTKSELVMFQGKEASNMVMKKIKKIEASTNYKVEFEIEAVSSTTENFTIIIEEQNKFLDKINQKEIKLDNYEGIKNIEFVTTPETTELGIFFESQVNDENTKLNIKSLKINEKEIVLNYKYLPTELVNKLVNIFESNKGIWERMHLLQQSIVASKDYNFIGIGGGAWRYIYTQYIDYNLQATEVHSYIGQIIVEFGIIGIIAYLGLITIVGVKTIQYLLHNKNNIKVISIACAIFILFVHSILDFEMSFFLILLTFYVLIAILQNNINKEEIIEEKYKVDLKYIVIIVSIILIVINLNSLCGAIYYEKIVKRATTHEERVQLQGTNLMLNPYNQHYLANRITGLQRYRKNTKNISKQQNLELLIAIDEYIHRLYKQEPYFFSNEIVQMFGKNALELIKNGEIERGNTTLKTLLEMYERNYYQYKYRTNENLEKMMCLTEITRLLKQENIEIAPEFKQVTDNSYKIIKEHWLDTEKCRQGEKLLEWNITELEKLMKSIDKKQ